MGVSNDERRKPMIEVNGLFGCMVSLFVAFGSFGGVLFLVEWVWKWITGG